MRIGVVADPALADAIGRLKAEWHAVTGNTLEVIEVESLEALSDGDGQRQARCSGDSGHRSGNAGRGGRLVDVPADVRDESAGGLVRHVFAGSAGGRLGRRRVGRAVGRAAVDIALSPRSVRKIQPLAADNLGRISSPGPILRQARKPRRRRAAGRSAPGTARSNRSLAAGGPSCCWRERRPTPSTATIFRRCSTSRISNRWWPARRLSARSKNWWPPIARAQADRSTTNSIQSGVRRGVFCRPIGDGVDLADRGGQARSRST